MSRRRWEGEATMHEQFQWTLDQLVERSGVGQEVFGEVLARTSLRAPEETSRVQIAEGNLNARRPVDQRAIPQGTVSKAVKALLEEGLLEAGERPLVRDGRALLSLRLGRRFVIAGVHVGHELGLPREVATALIGLDGRVICRPRHDLVPADTEDPWQAVAGLVRRQVAALKRRGDEQRVRSGDDPTGLFGIGLEIGAPVCNGQVLPLRGHQEHLAVDLSAAIRDELGVAELDIPVAVENDVNALAVLALHKAHYADPDLVVASVFDEGVGGGLVLDGRLRRGANGQAMEIGHLSVGLPPGAQPTRVSGGSPGGDAGAREPMAICACGEPGHVDALATPARIRAVLGVDSLAEASRQPADADSRVAAAFADAGAALGRAISHVSNTVNPGRLILFLPPALAEAAVGTAGACYLQAARQEIAAAFAAVDRENYLTVEALPADDAGMAELGATAAAACVLESFIEHALRLDGCPASARRGGRPASAA